MSHPPFRFQDKAAEILWKRSVTGLAIVGSDGLFLRVNRALCELLEYTECELLSKKFQEITHSEDSLHDVEMARRVAQGQIDRYTMAKRYLTKTGKIVWVSLTVDPVSGDDGEFQFFLSQITPPIECATTPEVMDKAGQNSVPDASTTEPNFWATVKRFLKGNWKWLVGAVIASALWINTQAIDQADKSRRLSEVEVEVAEMGSKVEKIDKSVTRIEAILLGRNGFDTGPNR